MRKAILGVVLAFVVVAALFVAARLGSHLARQPVGAGGSDPAQTAAQLHAGFQGAKRIGEWKLSCVAEQDAPVTPNRRDHAQRNSERNSSKAPSTAEWKIPRCRIFTELKIPPSTDEGIRVTFRRAGFRRTLSLFLRFPVSDVRLGDKVTVRLDKIDRTMSVHSCAKEFCLLMEPVQKVDVPSFLMAKRMILLFTARTSGKRMSVSVPTNGLAPAIAAMRRIDR